MKIGIMGAMSEEIAYLLEYYKEYETISFGGNDYHKVRFSNDGKVLKKGEVNASSELIIAISRIGKVNAALTASSLCLYFGIEKLIFNGVAGGISYDLKVGDLLLATKLAQHDADITIFGHPYGFFSGSKLWFESDFALNNIAKNAADELKIELKSGKVATGDQFISSNDKKGWIKATFNADCIEMEGAAVAVVCDSLKVPFCVIRAISDSAGDDALPSYETSLEEMAKRSSKLVVKMIEKMI